MVWCTISHLCGGRNLLVSNVVDMVFVSDIAGHVARHVNNRTHRRFFQPHDGGLCSPTAENIPAALEKNPTVQKECVNTLQSSMGPNIHEDQTADRFACPHPLTGTSEQYSL